MSDQPTNGTIPGAITRVSQSLITALPPSFLGLVVVNAIFIAAVMFFLTSGMDNRTTLVTKIVDHCLLQSGEIEAATARLDALEHDVRKLEAVEDRK